MTKKFLLCLIVLIPLKVSGLKYYTDYKSFLIGEDTFLEETENLKREEVKYYNTYEIEKNYYGYYPSDKCDFFDKSDYIEGSFNRNYGSTTMKDENTESIYIMYSDVYGFKLMKLLEENRIRDIVVLNEGKKIDFKVKKSSKDLTNLLDDDNDTFVDLEVDDSFELDFLKRYEIENIKVIIVADKPIVAKVASIQDNRTMNVTSYIKTNVINWVKDDEYEKLYKEFGYTENYNKYIQYHVLTGKMYNCYTPNKIILDEYKRDGDNLILDDFKIKYDYFLRDYIEIDENIVLDETTDLNSLIISSSYPIEEIKILNNINYEKNGYYDIDFVLGDFILSKKYELILNKNEIVVEDTTKEDDFLEDIVSDEYVNIDIEKPMEIVDNHLSNNLNKIKKRKKAIKKTKKANKVKKKNKKKNVSLVNNIEEEEKNQIIKVEPLKATVNKNYNSIYLIFSLLLLVIMLYLLYKHIREENR